MSDIPVIDGKIRAKQTNELQSAGALSDADEDFVTQGGVVRKTTLGAKKAHILAAVPPLIDQAVDVIDGGFF